MATGAVVADGDVPKAESVVGDPKRLPGCRSDEEATVTAERCIDVMYAGSAWCGMADSCGGGSLAQQAAHASRSPGGIALASSVQGLRSCIETWTVWLL